MTIRKKLIEDARDPRGANKNKKRKIVYATRRDFIVDGADLKKVSFTIPMPPSANRTLQFSAQHKDGTRHVFRDKSYSKLLKVELAHIIEEMGAFPISGPFKAKVIFYLKSVRSDLDNREKTLFDALQHVQIIENDFHCHQKVTLKQYHRDGESEWVYVELTQINLQGDLFEHIEFKHRKTDEKVPPMSDDDEKRGDDGWDQRMLRQIEVEEGLRSGDVFDELV